LVTSLQIVEAGNLDWLCHQSQTDWKHVIPLFHSHCFRREVARSSLNRVPIIGAPLKVNYYSQWKWVKYLKPTLIKLWKMKTSNIFEYLTKIWLNTSISRVFFKAFAKLLQVHKPKFLSVSLLYFAIQIIDKLTNQNHQ